MAHSRPLSKLDLEITRAVVLALDRSGQCWFRSVAVAPASRRPTGLRRAVTGELERPLRNRLGEA
jgi:hypothetical protein